MCFFLPFLAFGVRRRAASFFLTLSHWSHWRQAHPSYMYIFRTATGHRWRRRKKENTSPLGWGWNWGFRTPVKSWCGIGLLLRVEQPCSCGICRIFMGSRFPRCFWPSKRAFFPWHQDVYKCYGKGGSSIFFSGRCDRFPRTTPPHPHRCCVPCGKRPIGRSAVWQRRRCKGGSHFQILI